MANATVEQIDTSSRRGRYTIWSHVIAMQSTNSSYTPVQLRKEKPTQSGMEILAILMRSDKKASKVSHETFGPLHKKLIRQK